MDRVNDSIKGDEMATVKDVILTAVYFKGLQSVRKESAELADKCLCSAGYVRAILNKVEKGQIRIVVR